MKFIKGARPGLKRPAQVTSDSATNTEKRFKYEKEKRPERSKCFFSISEFLKKNYDCRTIGPTLYQFLLDLVKFSAGPKHLEISENM
jgi:hypothetical protein